MTEEAHQEDVSSLGTTWYLGIAKNKTVCHYQQQRLSTLLLEVAAHNSCGLWEPKFALSNFV